MSPSLSAALLQDLIGRTRHETFVRAMNGHVRVRSMVQHRCVLERKMYRAVGGENCNMRDSGSLAVVLDPFQVRFSLEGCGSDCEDAPYGSSCEEGIS